MSPFFCPELQTCTHMHMEKHTDMHTQVHTWTHTRAQACIHMHRYGHAH